MRRFLTLILACAVSWSATRADEPAQEKELPRWSAEQANAWYAKQPWLVGCNFIPSTAINQLEMWQPETFDPKTIDRELGLAQSIGFNTVRVFLHNLPWRDDRKGTRSDSLAPLKS